MWKPPDLSKKVTVVAGATRGCGRAIAVTLGECGATVICTGRSVKGSLSSGETRPETIDQTAEMVTQAGGKGIAIRCDHTCPEDVVRLVSRIKEEFGELHFLINDFWGGDSLMADLWGKNLWESDLSKGLQVLHPAVQGHIITSHGLLPLLSQTAGGILIEVTDGDHMGYRGNFFYDLAKSSVIRMAFCLHKELSKKSCRAFCVTPGFIRSEAMLDIFKCTEANYKTEAADADFRESSESPYLVARGIAHLLAQPPAKFGVFGSWSLSDMYSFADKDGTSPHWGNYFEKKYGKITAGLDAATLASWEFGPVDALESSSAAS